jgi:hypothetical protein
MDILRMWNIMLLSDQAEKEIGLAVLVKRQVFSPFSLGLLSFGVAAPLISFPAGRGLRLARS